MTSAISFRCWVLFAFILLNGRGRIEVGASGFDAGDTVEVYKLMKLLYDMEVIRNQDTKNLTKLFDVMRVANSKLANLDVRFEDAPENIFNKGLFLDLVLIEAEAIQFETNVIEIKSRYNQMVSILENIDEYDNSSKTEFVEKNMIRGPDSIVRQLFNVFFMYFGYRQKIEDKRTRIPLIDKILLEFQYGESHNLCPTVTAQQHFYNDYLGITILEMKGYLVEMFSWAIISYLKGENFFREKYYSRIEHERRGLFMIYKMRKVLSEASRELRTCDPDKWEEKVNYEKLTRLFQGYIFYDKNLCIEDCNKYVNKTVDDYSKDKLNNKWKKSSNEILSCEPDFRKDVNTICPLHISTRSYHHIEKNSYFFDERVNCSKPENFIESPIREVESCNSCFCLVDANNENSDRFFNLRETLSDVHQNMVVTGVRFTKKNRVIYLQIQQGKLSSFGLINRTSIEWKDVDEYELNEQNNGVDYVTLHNGLKSINLDDIEVDDPNYIVTGVKLTQKDSYLYMEIRVSEFEYQTGKLFYPNYTSKWISSTTEHDFKIPLSDSKLNKGPRVSTRSPTKSSPTPAAYDVVEFTHSDKISDDSQTTLPYFDAQDVVSELPTPLSGVGLYHRGIKGYGGFLALKIFNLDVSGYI